MRHRLLFAVLAASLAVPVFATGAQAGDFGAEAREIVEAYRVLGDLSSSVGERAEVLEGGEKLQKVLRRTTDLDTLVPEYARELAQGLAPDFELFQDITVRRIHRDSAEVEFGIYLGPMLVTGWTGVAVREDGHWKASRGTFCSILADWSVLSCPGVKSASDSGFGAHPGLPVEAERGNVIPLTFADGSRAELVLPRDHPTAWRLQPRAAFRFRGQHITLSFNHQKVVARQPVLKYAGAQGKKVVLDAQLGLLIRAGDWTVSMDVSQLTEDERRLVARHLGARETRDGLVVLEMSGPLGLQAQAPVRTVKSALTTADDAFPMELTLNGSGSYTLITVTLGPCPEQLQRYAYDGYHAEERCLPGGDARIAVEGSDIPLVQRLLEEARVRNIEHPEREEAAAFA